ncbi:hypothetical protein VTG60DRAFT_6169 [Thermothelomyces hinnuleus]
MKAYKLISKGNAAVVEVPKPALRPDGVLVRVAYVALNPTDWKHVRETEVRGGAALTVGCDFAGVVEEVGAAVARPGGLRPGDRVCGMVHGTHTLRPEDGAFAEYLVAKPDLLLPIPDHMGFPEAATLGVQVYTVGQGLFQSLGLPWPTEPLKSEDRFPILIYGGSTAMGTLGIQMAKLSGLEVITTCSPHNFDLVKSLGADKAFDYRTPDVGAAIREYTNNRLRHVWDTIGGPGAEQICADALSSSSSSSPEPGAAPLRYSAITGSGVLPRADVQADITLAYTAHGEACEVWGGKIRLEARPEDLEFARRWGSLAARLFAEKKVVPHPAEIRGGLDDITAGLRDLEEGRVSGKKLVYRVADL